jgi:hypothetical protein
MGLNQLLRGKDEKEKLNTKIHKPEKVHKTSGAIHQHALHPKHGIIRCDKRRSDQCAVQMVLSNAYS